MNIALFGASGMIGQRILAEATRRGHTVTAIGRSPSKLAESHPGIATVASNVLDPQQVAAAVAGHDAVVSSISPRHDSPEDLPDATRSLIAGLAQAGVKRLVIVGGAGSLYVAPGVQLVDTPAIPDEWRPMVLAHRSSLDLLRAEGGALEWSFFSPAGLIRPGERTGAFRLGLDELITDAQGNSSISAEDYAVALLDELEQPKHIRQRFTIGY